MRRLPWLLVPGSHDEGVDIQWTGHGECVGIASSLRVPVIALWLLGRIAFELRKPSAGERHALYIYIYIYCPRRFALFP